MTKANSKKTEEPGWPRCPKCGHVIKPYWADVPFDPEGCIVLRNRKGIAAKCRTPLDRDCRACPVWLAMKEEEGKK